MISRNASNTLSVTQLFCMQNIHHSVTVLFIPHIAAVKHLRDPVTALKTLFISRVCCVECVNAMIKITSENLFNLKQK